MGATHVFTLHSGIEAECTELLAKHQRLLTEGSNKNNISESFNDVLADVLVRVGSEKDIDKNFVANMLSNDRKKALIEIRQFSLDFPEIFVYSYNYKSQSGKKSIIEFNIDISEGFNSVPLKDFEDNEYKEVKYNEYNEITRDIEFVLPKSLKKVKIKLLDGQGELMMARTSKKEISSHTPIKIRRPQVETETSGGTKIWHSLDLDTLSILDIEHIRNIIKNVEGSIDTEYMFEHPETGEDITVELTSNIAFFFPSTSI